MGRLQVGSYPGNGAGAGVASLAQIENEAGVSYDVPAKTGGSYLTLAQIFFDFSKQIHSPSL